MRKALKTDSIIHWPPFHSAQLMRAAYRLAIIDEVVKLMSAVDLADLIAPYELKKRLVKILERAKKDSNHLLLLIDLAP